MDAAPLPTPGWPPTSNPDPEAEDRALLAGVAAGDRRAFEALYRRHAGWLVVRLSRRCGEPELVDSALQDTFVAVWRSAHTFQGTGDVGGWLWGIAVRRLVDQQRRRKPVPVDLTEVPRGPEVSSGSGSSGGLGSTGVDSAPSAEMAALSATVAGGDLADALAALPADLRGVMLATAIDGLTTAEAAAQLGIPQGTVKTRLMRARHLLQGYLR